MKKSVMKRCIAMLLVAAMIFTSVNTNWSLTSKAAGSITAADLVASNYELAEAEKEILLSYASEQVTGEEYQPITMPADDNSDGLVAVDTASDTPVIYAKCYETPSGYYTWVPETAKIVGELTEKTVELELLEEPAVYQNESYDASAVFEFAEQGYQVQVTYQVYIDVEVEQQQAMFDAFDTLEKVYAYTEIIENTASGLDSVTPYISELLVYEAYLLDVIDAFRELEAQTEKEGNGGYCDLSALWNSVSDSEVKHVLDNVEDYQTVIVDTYDIAKVIVDSAANGNLYDLIGFFETQLKAAEKRDNEEAIKKWTLALLAVDSVITTFTTIKNDLEPLTLTANWEGMSSDILDVTADYSAFDDAVLALVEDTSDEDRDIEYKTSLLAGTTTVSCNVNSYDVVFVFNAEVYVGSTKLELTREYKQNFVSGTVDKVSAKLADFEESALAAWAEYNVGTQHYDRAAEDLSGLIPTGKLNADLEYVVTYSPKTYTVTYDSKNAVDVLYGQTVTLPCTAVANKSYEYVIEGVTYLEGESYTVLGNVSAERSLVAKKVNTRVYGVAADQYSAVLGNEAVKILGNEAVDCTTHTISNPISDNVEIKNGVIEAANQVAYEADGTTYYWVADSAVVKNAAGTVETLSFVNGEAVITDPTAYQSVDVYYELVLADVSDAEIIDALNAASELVEDAKAQMESMDALVNNRETLGKVSAGTISMLHTFADTYNFGQDARDAIDELSKCCNKQGNLYLVAHADAYAELTSKYDQLSYYYQNCDDISSQIDMLYKNLNTMLEDEGVKKLLEDQGITSIDSVKDRVKSLKDGLCKMDERINKRSDSYVSLLKAIVAGVETGVPSFADTFSVLQLVMTSNAVSKPAENVCMITVSVNGSSQPFYVSKGEEGNASLLSSIEKAVDEMEADIDTLHYTVALSVVNDNGEVAGYPEAGSKITENLSITYTWTPKTYKINLYDETADNTIEGYESVTWANPSFTLAAPTDKDLKYYYTIDGVTRTVSYGQEATYSFDTEVAAGAQYSKFDQLLAEGSYTISRKTVSVANEGVQNLIIDLNNALISAGLQDAMSFIPYEDAQQQMSVVLRVNPTDVNNVLAAFMEIAPILVQKAAYIGIGGTDAKPGHLQGFLEDGNIHLDAFVSAVLDSGFSTDRLNDAINGNGAAVNKCDVKGTIMKYADKESAIKTPDKTGGILMDMTMALTEGNAISLYITYQDYGTGSAYMSKLDKALTKAAPYVDIECVDGAIETVITAPEKAHELFLAAMLLEGEIDVKTFETPSLVEMVEYVDELAIDPLIMSGDVDGATVLNTLAELGVDRDVSEYEALMTKLFVYAKKVLESEYVTALNTEGQDNNLYKGQISCPESKIQSAISSKVGEVSGMDVGSMIKGDVVIPMNTTLTNCDTEYTAAIIDLEQAKIYNKVDLVTTKDITVASEDAIVILLADVDSVTVNEKVTKDKSTGVAAYLNLNGHDVKEVLTVNGKSSVTVVDSRLSSTDSFVNSVAGTNVSVTAGTYGVVLSDSMLPDGYSQDANGTVANRFYKIVEDADGNIQIQVSADFMEMEEATAWTKLAVEMAADAAFDLYAWAGAAVVNKDTNKTIELYEVEFEDLLASYKDGKKAIAETLINDTVNGGAGFVAFANDLIAELTDFAAVSQALKDGKSVVTYDLVTKNWDVQLKAAEDDYITVDVAGSEDTTTRTVEIVFVDNYADDGEDSVKILSDLFAELDEIVKIVKAEISGGFEYYRNSGFDYYGNASLDVIVDLTNDQYIAVMGIVMAYGMEDNGAMKAAVESYLTAGGTAGLVAEIEALTSAQIFASMKAAKGVTFETMCEALGIEDEYKISLTSLEALYDDALQLAYLLVNYLGFTGGTRTFGSFNNGEFATYEITKTNWNHFENLHLKLILANEKYTVTFLDWDDSVISSESYKAGAEINIPKEIPERAGTGIIKRYQFTGWDPAVVSTAKADATYKAQYDAYCDVVFEDAEGNIISTKEYKLAETVTVPANPEKQATAKYTYAFVGWKDKATGTTYTNGVPAVEKNTTYVPVYTAVVNSYTVVWKNYDGTVLETDENVEYGTTPTYDGATPTKPSTAKYQYTFKGWTPEVSEVTGDVTFTAEYKASLRSYTVTWVNYDGTVLETDTVKYGKMPTYDGEKPVKPWSLKYKYFFAGWLPEVSEVTEDVTYRAYFIGNIKEFEVTWVNYDGTVLEVDTVKYGRTPTYDGKTPTKASTSKYKYTFTGWTPEIEKVTGDATYTATFKATKIKDSSEKEDDKVTKYTIIFKDYDGSIISKKVYEKGAVIKVPADPTRKADSKYTYTFAGWSPKVVKTAKANATYTATYTKKAIKPIDVSVKDVDITSVKIAGKGAIYGYYVDEDNKLIYLDVTTDGLTHTEFNKYVEFEVENADKVTKSFSDNTNKLVQTGEKIKITASNKTSKETVSYTIIVLGDVVLDGGVGDGRIRANDATVILKHCVGKLTLKGNAARAAKINSSNGIDAGDATIVLKKSVENPNYKTWLDK